MSIQEQAIEYIHEALSPLDAALIAEIVTHVPEIPLSLVGMSYCAACESVLCGACGHCHSWDLQPNAPECPGDNDDVGHDALDCRGHSCWVHCDGARQRHIRIGVARPF